MVHTQNDLGPKSKHNKEICRAKPKKGKTSVYLTFSKKRQQIYTGTADYKRVGHMKKRQSKATATNCFYATIIYKQYKSSTVVHKRMTHPK